MAATNLTFENIHRHYNSDFLSWRVAAELPKFTEIKTKYTLIVQSPKNIVTIL